jgi:hypothetical protein
MAADSTQRSYPFDRQLVAITPRRPAALLSGQTSSPSHRAALNFIAAETQGIEVILS